MGIEVESDIATQQTIHVLPTAFDIRRTVPSFDAPLRLLPSVKPRSQSTAHRDRTTHNPLESIE